MKADNRKKKLQEKDGEELLLNPEDAELEFVNDFRHFASWEKSDSRIWKKRLRLKRLRRALAAVVILVALYLTGIYSNIPVIARLRTIYIETAMGTMTHQWLATAFIPKSVIDAVMDPINANKGSQTDLETVWETEEESEAVIATEIVEKPKTEEELFYEKYWELDTDSFRKHLEEHPEALENGYDNIVIEYLSTGSDIYDVNGNQVYAIDCPNNTLVMKVSGPDYVGKIAIVKDSSQVDLVKSAYLGSQGQTISDFANSYDAEIAINASWFVDPEGHGMGGTVKGSLVLDGVDYGNPVGGTWKFFGMKNDDLFYITNYSSSIVSEYRWAIECIPALIVNGESVVDGSFGTGIQPRSTIGQTAEGGFVYVVVDGRQVGYSLGCTVADCADIMLQYHVVQGANLDGGSSSVMYYKGIQITKSCSGSGSGRYSPDCLIFRKAYDVQ